VPDPKKSNEQGVESTKTRRAPRNGWMDGWMVTKAKTEDNGESSGEIVSNICSSSRDITATVRLYRILQLNVFFFRSFSCMPTRSVDVWFQGVMPSLITLFFRSTWDQRGNFIPILATVR
jgi:hypothetical protein